MIAQNAIILLLSSAALCLVFYIIYQRFFHPLSAYPGPFWACLTDVWQAYQFFTLRQPYYLTNLHKKYGPIVRYGPDKLSITSESAVPLIYQKGGRNMPKTEFYKAYGGRFANVFGMTNEEEHALRRRHMSHSFSITYVKEMEVWLDLNIKVLKENIAAYAQSGQAFDLKKELHYYIIDVLGELAFSQNFGLQKATDPESMVPPVIEHSLLAAVTGAWPRMTSTLKTWLPYVPSKPLQKLFAGRRAIVNLAATCVERRLHDLKDVRDDDDALRQQRKDILTSLILAKHPDTHERLTQTELETEAFGFIIAGTHTTSATTTLLFWHLLHSPDILQQVVNEVNDRLPPLDHLGSAYPIALLESSLPFMRDCIRENFRNTPVFTMPLARYVTVPEGLNIDGHFIPPGTSVAVCNHAFHHNPKIWGSDHAVFDPSRWKLSHVSAKSRYLMHFGLGARQCIGKTIATTNIYKLTASLLRSFEFELADEADNIAAAQGAFKGQLPSLISVGVSDLEGPLMVKARIRKPAEA